MNKKIISQDNIDEILSRATYWNEVVERENSPVGDILWNELTEIAHSLGTKILWILEEYAKECKKSITEVKEDD